MSRYRAWEVEENLALVGSRSGRISWSVEVDGNKEWRMESWDWAAFLGNGNGNGINLYRVRRFSAETQGTWAIKRMSWPERA
jgi:hypothetical protein